MSRTAACVISLVLGLPILAMIAIAAAGGFDPRLLTTFLVGGVVMAFVVGAIFEIKRLLDSDHHASSATMNAHGSAIAVRVADAPIAQEPTSDPTPDREIRLEAPGPVPADMVAPASEPIVLETVPEPEPRPSKAKTAARTGRAKRIAVSDSPSDKGEVAPKPKRKPGRSKQATPV